MKAPAVTLATLLLLAICSPAEAHLDTIPTSCCFTYTQKPIPHRFITSAYTTSNMCSQPAVVLVTKKGKELCTDPQAPWVKKLLNYLEMQDI
ncbi:CCL4 protein, partial [Thinocorus orbignyianus]|nr:CCL4 protein [Thinocorus orbignyianus]